MLYFNIQNPSEKTTLKNAILQSIGNETGLYMPEVIPTLPVSFFTSLPNLSLPEIADTVATAMFAEDIPAKEITSIVYEALNFPIPLKKLKEDLYVLELFHGPTLAFKDVGARFMAGLFSYFLQDDTQEVSILAATSGDTGSAVANAFYNKKGIKVYILYPSGKVSALQEKQLTTMGGNITALEVDGNFDDCQKLVKQAFADKALNQRMRLTSANSINFARLFPQSFYYFHAIAQLGKINKSIVVSVPSGNFGNLTAGLIAKRMGLGIDRFIAATNSNHSVPDYLTSGYFMESNIVHTISNAMDVAKPSNFSRMLSLYANNHQAMSKDIAGHWCNEEETRKAMRLLLDEYNYVSDPHSAIAFDALAKQSNRNEVISIFLETAHPAKFPEEVEKVSHQKVEIPEALQQLFSLQKNATFIPNNYEAFIAELK